MKRFLLALAFTAASLCAQSVSVPGDGAPGAITVVSSNPTASSASVACSNPATLIYNYRTGHIWGCAGAPGSYAFTDITEKGLAGMANASMATFNAALHYASSKLVRVALIGDSWTEGAGFSSVSNIWAQQLKTHLQTQFGNGGSGVIPVHSALGAWTIATGCNTVPGLGPSQTIGASFNTLYQCAGNTNTASLSVPFYGDHIVIYYATYTDSGSGFQVAVDGGGNTTYGAATTSTYTPASVSISASAGWHTAVITFPSSGNCYLYAFETISGTTGVRVDNYGRGGAVSGAFGNPAQALAFLQQPSLAVIALGVNDFGNSITPATYQQNLQNIVTYLQSNFTPAPSILILDQGNVSELGTYPQSQYRAIEQQVASANGAAFLSVGERWGSFTNANTNLGLMYSDGIHPNDTGHRDIARMIERRILDQQDFLANYVFADSAAGNMFVGNLPAEGSPAQMIKSTGVGYSAGGTGAFANTGSNTWLGYQALSGLTTGHNNTAVGTFACGSLTTGNFTTCIGQNANVGASTGGSVQLGSGTLSQNNALGFQSIIVNGVPTTVLNGPSCGSTSKGSRWTFIDSTVTTYGTTIAGSGTNTVSAWCNGTNWVVD